MPRRTTPPGKAKPKPSKGKAKSLGPYQSYAHLNWGQIRHEYETTPISMGELCRRHGIKSDGTVRKQSKADGGWKKNVDAITSGLVQAGIAAEAGDELSPLFAGRQPPVIEMTELAGKSLHAAHNMMRADGAAARAGLPRTPLAQSKNSKAKPRKAPKADADAAGPALPQDRPSREQSTGDAPPPGRDAGTVHEALLEPMHEVPLPPGDLAEVAAVRTASDLARLHIAAVKQQLTTARSLRLVTNLVLARIFVAVGAPTAEDAGEARGALMFLNPERETLAGLLKACSDVAERSIQIERRALSMDPRTGAPPPAPPEPPVPVNQVAIEKLVGGLSNDVLMQLRGAAAQLSKLSPNQRPAAKAAELEAVPEPQGEST